MLCEVYARVDGSIANIITGGFGAPDDGVTRIIYFDADAYPIEHQTINSVDSLFWDGANLQIDSVVYLDAAWIAARQAEFTQAANIEAEDETEQVALLSQYNAALTQIGNDLGNVATGKTALASATTLAQVKPIVDGMLTILEHQLNREERELKALRAILRSGLT